MGKRLFHPIYWYYQNNTYLTNLCTSKYNRVLLWLKKDYLTVGLAQPQVDGQQDWALTYAKEENGKTTLQLYRRRDTRDPIGDVRIQVK